MAGKKIYTIDCETDPFEFGNINIAPFAWGIFDGRAFSHFRTTLDLVNHIKNTDGIFFAHNGGKFDFHFLAEFINRNEKVLMINSRLVQARIGHAEIRDSYALLPFPLSAYKKDEIDYKKLHKTQRDKHMPEILKYLEGDCVYLYELVTRFFDDYGRHLTAPSAAIKQLAKIEGIKIENSGRYFFGEFQKHYFGGRCECINPGSYTNKKITYLDINSAYAYAMKSEHPFGTEFDFYHKKNPEIIPHGFYTIKAKSFGALCRRDEGSLKFDWDGVERIYHTTGHEIIAGLETKKLKITKHIEQKIFKETKNFSKFIDHFWSIRKSSKKGTPQNLFAKLMLCSAYGKLAANPSNYDTFVLYDPSIAETLVNYGWDLRGKIGPHIIASKPMDKDDMRYYNVATGASITGYVRAMLLRALANVTEPIYCDTDSIIFTGVHTLELSDELGAWKIEGIFDEGHFAGKKLYAVKNKKETKTANKGARLKFHEIKKLCQGEEILYKQEAPIFSWYKEPKILMRKIKKTA